MIVEVMSNDMIDLAALACVAAAEDAARLAEQVIDEVDVVHVQIEQCAAGLLSFLIPASGNGSAAAEGGGEDLAVVPFDDGALQQLPFRPEAHAHGGHEVSLGR